MVHGFPLQRLTMLTPTCLLNCRHRLTINMETQFIPRTLNFGNGNGADFLILYAQNYGNSLDLEGQTPPSSGLTFCHAPKNPHQKNVCLDRMP